MQACGFGAIVAPFPLFVKNLDLRLSVLNFDNLNSLYAISLFHADYGLQDIFWAHESILRAAIPNFLAIRISFVRFSRYACSNQLKSKPE